MRPVALLFATLLVAPLLAWADPVHSEDEALRIAVRAIRVHRLTTLRDECGTLAVIERRSVFDVVVRERHVAGCGGDPETKPRLFTLRVRKHDGAISSDAGDGVHFRSLRVNGPVGAASAASLPSR